MKVIGNLSKDAIIRAAVSEGFTVTQVLGSETTFESGGRCDGVDIVYDANAQKVVIAYRDNSNSAYGTAIVGTVSDTSISFGSATVFNTGTTDYIRIDYDANAQKVVIVYKDQNSKGKAIVGTVSGTSISFGSSAEFGTNIAHISIAYDTNAQKNVISYQNGADSDHGYAIVGTVSGTSISFGSAAEYENSSVLFTETTYDSTAQKVILAWRDSGDSNKGKAAVGTVSGTSISYGSIVTFASGGIDEVRLAYDPNQNKTGFFYKDNGNSYYGTSTVATVSGTSISFGAAQVFNSAEIREYAAIYDTLAQRIVLTYRDIGNGERGTILTASISGTSMTFGTAAVFSENPRRIHSTYDSNQQRVVCAYDDEGLNQGRSIVIKTGYTSATGGTIADGSAVIVNANGTVSTVSTNAASAGSEQDSGVTGNGGWVTSALPSTSAFVGFAQSDSGNSNYGTAIVGTVSGSTITYGTKAQATTMTYPELPNVIGMTSTTFVIVYKNGSSSNRGEARVGTISGTGASATISFGSAVTFESGQTTLNQVHSVDRLTDTKFVIAFQDASDNGKAKCIIGTVSGTSVSFGSAATFSTANTSLYTSVSALSETKFVAIWSNTPTPEAGKVIIGTVSGTSISYGSPETYDSDRVVRHSVAAVSDSKFVIAYNDNRLVTNYGTAIAGTVSGDAITLGTPVVWRSSAEGNAYPSVVKLTSDSFAIAGLNDDARGSIFEGSLSGTTITFASPVQFKSTSGTEFWATLVNNEKVVIGYDSTNLSASVYTSETSTLTTENFVGFMKGAALDGTNGEILSSCSIARNQTSLTPGQTYFVSPTDGSISTSAGSPSVTAGTAISSTEIIVKG